MANTSKYANGEFNSGAPAVDTAPLAGSGTLPPLPPLVSPSEVGAAGFSPRGVPPGRLHDQVAREAEVQNVQPTQPLEGEWAGSDIYKHKGDGFRYQVVRRASDPFNKPVKARMPAQKSGHPGFYWEGSEEEFAATFTKE